MGTDQNNHNTHLSSPEHSQRTLSPTPDHHSTHTELVHSNHDSLAELDQIQDPESVGVFLQRVGKIPLVSGVVRAYERGKDTSKMVRYGADLVESSVNSLSDRVVSKVGPERIAQIDRYAGAALDRLGQFSHAHQSIAHHHHHYHHHHHVHHHHFDGLDPDRQSFDHSSLLQQSSCFEQHHSSSSHSIQDPLSDHFIYFNSSNSFHSYHTPHTLRSQFQTPHRHSSSLDNRSPSPPSTPSARSDTFHQVSTVSGNGKSRWQNILVEASMTAGGIGAAVSEESMKSLQYCLHWLHYATAHLDHQITALRDFISSLDDGEEEIMGNGILMIEAVARLASINKEVVDTIRKVVDVVSKYARAGLPEPAIQFVRKSILGLPLRWASALRVGPLMGSLESEAGQRNPSPSGRTDKGNQSHAATQIAAHRVLTFAVESLTMLKSITGTFSESIERADAWVVRLRSMGLQNRNYPDPDHRQYRPRSMSNSRELEGDEGCSRLRGQSGEGAGWTRRRDEERRSRSLGRYRQNPRVRSRSSSSTSTTTFEDDMSIESGRSLMSSCTGYGRSTGGSGSMRSSNVSTLASSFTSNHHSLHHDPGPAGSAAKRRKANRHLPHPPAVVDPQRSLATLAAALPSSCDGDEMAEDDEREGSPPEGPAGHWPPHSDASRPWLGPDRWAERDARPNLPHHPRPALAPCFSTSTPLTHSSSLKKLLLDPDAPMPLS